MEWTVDGQRFALTVGHADHIGLWVGSVEGEVTRIKDLALNPLMGTAVSWLPDQERLLRLLGEGSGSLDIETAWNLAQKVREMAQADVGLSIVGFPEKDEESSSITSFTAAIGDGFQKDFSWYMGGHFRILQERGAVTGLNTLRLALLETM